MRITVMLQVLAGRRRLMLFVTLKRKYLPKERFPSAIMFKRNQNWWMTEELYG
jgi:hypothetical protein